MPAWIYKDAAKPAQPEETIDDVKHAYALLFKENAALRAESERLRGALSGISEMTYDPWTNGAIAQRIAEQAISYKEPA